MMEEWRLKVQAIYLNSRQHMKNTEEDWEKVFGAFRKVLDECDNVPLVVAVIQEAIIKLEDYLREKR